LQRGWGNVFINASIGLLLVIVIICHLTTLLEDFWIHVPIGMNRSLKYHKLSFILGSLVSGVDSINRDVISVLIFVVVDRDLLHYTYFRMGQIKCAGSNACMMAQPLTNSQ